MTADEGVRLYTVAELAVLWKVSKTFVYAEINAQRLPVVRLGRGDRDKTRVRASDALAWIERRQTGADTRISRRAS
jgi:excisionase family DNA binding protein